MNTDTCREQRKDQKRDPAIKKRQPDVQPSPTLERLQAIDLGDRLSARVVTTRFGGGVLLHKVGLANESRRIYLAE